MFLPRLAGFRRIIRSGIVSGNADNQRSSLSLRDRGVQALVPVVQVRTDTVALVLPEFIGGVIIPEYQAEYLADSFLLQSLLRFLYKRPGDSSAAASRIHTHVMYDRPPAVMACKNHSDHLLLLPAAFFRICQKACRRVAFQISFYSGSAVVHRIQRAP